ncbi:hypothetical protein CspeluHIS016_0701370 [Cutaneotrichosporon spelunceum]|uniref:Uncharacterized protein n=1 Tax=Cutaneotrichosporon spelunceum TaxID=1672016 RepID=A0AAD3YEL7_9TREE|nr:hypothetical protein CspeluHIS016_0701370 [Cutaneotrichosporon spelunceum]
MIPALSLFTRPDMDLGERSFMMHEVLAALLVLVGLLSVRSVKSSRVSTPTLVGKEPTEPVQPESSRACTLAVAANLDELTLVRCGSPRCPALADGSCCGSRADRAGRPAAPLRLVRFLWRMWAGVPEPTYMWWCIAEEMRRF